MKILHIGCCATGLPLNGFQKALLKKFVYDEVYTGNKDVNYLSEQKSKSLKPDLVFLQIQRDGIISSNLIKYFKDNGIFVINWSGDVRQPTPQWYYEVGRQINLTCFSNKNDVENLLNSGIKADYLDIGYDPDIYNPKGNHLNCPDIIFMANTYDQFPLSQYRADLVRFLKSKYVNNFSTYGSGSNAGSFMGNQLGEAAMYRSCKIAINCSNFQYKRYSSDRILRIMGSGALCLTHFFPEIEVDYKDGIHLIVWQDFNDLQNKIDYYLNHESERKQIAAAGHELVFKKHTFDKMVQNIKKLYLKHK